MRIRLNLNWCFLLFIMLFLSFSYAFDAWEVNLPQGLAIIFVILYLLCMTVRHQKLRIVRRRTNIVLRGYGFLFLLALFGVVMHGVSVLGYDVLRFFYLPIFVLFFLRVITSEEILQNTMRLFGWIFWISFFLFLFQQFILGTTRDELTGIFGITTGNQGYTNLLLVFYSLYVLAMYLGGNMKGGYTIAVLVVCLYQAAIGEIKIYFVAMIIVAVCLFCMSRLTLRKCGIAIFLFVSSFLAVSVLEILYPEFSGFLSLDALIQSITNKRGYTSTGDINRLNGILIMRRYMNSPMTFLTGLGVGNAGPGTSFYKNYRLLHYNWFAYSYIFVELGILGLATLLVTHIQDSIKLLFGCYNEKDQMLKNYYLISFTSSIILIAYIFYNEKHFSIIGAMYCALFISLPSLYQNATAERGIQE